MAKAQKSKLSPQILQERLSAALSKLETVQKEHEVLKRRGDCITEFIQRVRDYQIAKTDAKHHEILLEWMLQQIPLIKGELLMPNDHGLDRRGGKTALKRKRSEEQRRDDGVNGFSPDRLAPAVVIPGESNGHDESPSKRLRRATSLHHALPNSADPNPSTRTLKTSKSTSKIENKPRNAKGQAPSDQLPRMSKPLRRSPRIAARAGRLEATIPATLPHGLTPASSTLPKEPQRRRSRLKMARRRHPLKRS
jgi:hypothetical protein